MNVQIFYNFKSLTARSTSGFKFVHHTCVSGTGPGLAFKQVVMSQIMYVQIRCTEHLKLRFKVSTATSSPPSGDECENKLHIAHSAQ